jgi:hypothetical protein
MAGLAADSSAIEQFNNAGGTVVLVGECQRYAGQANDDINGVLTALGSPLRLVTDSKC